MVERIQEIARRHDLLIGTFGHAGDGNLHPTCVLDPDDADAVERAHRAFAEIFGAAIELGGSITGEHGVGMAKLPYLARQLGDDHVALLRRIKRAFDPNGILNPGKLVPPAAEGAADPGPHRPQAAEWAAGAGPPGPQAAVAGRPCPP